MHRFIPVVAGSIPIGQARLQVGDRSLKLYRAYICTYKRRRRERREGTMDGLRVHEYRVELSVIINNDVARRVSLMHLPLLSDRSKIAKKFVMRFHVSRFLRFLKREENFVT